MTISKRCRESLGLDAPLLRSLSVLSLHDLIAVLSVIPFTLIGYALLLVFLTPLLKRHSGWFVTAARC